MPTLVLGLVLASLYGIVFYLIFGHGWLRLFFYWVVGILGFGMGHFIASMIGLALMNIGALNFVEGTVACWLCLFAARARWH